jgi:CheY-like chemotaxis protein
MGEDELLRKHILLVEDERFVRESIARLLCKDEHTAVEANNGAEAFALFTRSKIDLTPPGNGCRRARWEQSNPHYRNPFSDTNEHQRTWLNSPEWVMRGCYENTALRRDKS